MNLTFLFSTFFEIALGGFIIWGIFNEQKLVDFEDRMFGKIKSAISPCFSARRSKRI